MILQNSTLDALAAHLKESDDNFFSKGEALIKREGNLLSRKCIKINSVPSQYMVNLQSSSYNISPFLPDLL